MAANINTKRAVKKNRDKILIVDDEPNYIDYYSLVSFEITSGNLLGICRTTSHVISTGIPKATTIFSLQRVGPPVSDESALIAGRIEVKGASYFHQEKNGRPVCHCNPLYG